MNSNSKLRRHKKVEKRLKIIYYIDNEKVGIFCNLKNYNIFIILSRSKQKLISF